MGRHIVKHPDISTYVEWSSFTESPIWIGSRQELIARMLGDCITWNDTTRGPWYLLYRLAFEKSTYVEPAIIRADTRCTSNLIERDWQGEILMQRGWLPRNNFPKLVELLLDDTDLDDTRVSALLEPFED